MGCSSAITRLAAMLSLKAAVVRRWKDRGRGKLLCDGGTTQLLLSEPVKHVVRQSVLQIVVNGSIPTIHELHQMIGGYSGSSAFQMSYISSIEMLSPGQAELIQDVSLQTNAAALLSKIGRMDLPLKFHELIPSLVYGVQYSQEAIRSSNQESNWVIRTLQVNIMSALDALFGEMSTQRLLVDKKYRNDIARQYLCTVVEYGLVPSLESDFTNGGVFKKYAIITSRVVSTLLVSSFSKLMEESSTAALVEHTLSLVKKFLAHWLPLLLNENNSPTDELLELLSIHCNIITELQSSHPTFHMYSEPFLVLFYDSFSIIFRTFTQVPKALERLVVSFISCLANAATTLDETAIYGRFFCLTLVQSLARQALLLFSCHLYIADTNSTEDEYAYREYWLDNPEGFYQWELQRSSEDDVGCAAQNLFLALIETNRGKEVIVPWFVGLLSDVSVQQLVISLDACVVTAPSDETSMASLPLGCNKINTDLAQELILQYDAIYTGFGLVGEMIENERFTFKSFFDAILLPGLSMSSTKKVS